MEDVKDEEIVKTDGVDDEVVTLLKDIQGQLVSLTQVIDTIKPVVEDDVEEKADEVEEELEEETEETEETEVDLEELDSLLQED